MWVLFLQGVDPQCFTSCFIHDILYTLYIKFYFLQLTQKNGAMATFLFKIVFLDLFLINLVTEYIV